MAQRAARREQGGHRLSAGAPRQPVILIAEDNTDARELYADHFGRRGYIVLTAHDGAAAVRAALEHVPDVIIMDLAMPQFDGITAIRQIRANRETRRCRLILLTGYPQKAVERGALEAGADRFLTKPCVPEELEGHVRELRRRRRRSR